MPIKTCLLCGHAAHVDFRGDELPCPADMAFGPYRSDDYKVANKSNQRPKLTKRGPHRNRRWRQQDGF